MDLTINNTIKLFLLGGCRPQTPCCSWGASSPPDPLAGGLQPPVPPVPRSLEEPVLGDGGTALSANPNRYPFFTVRTPQASLVWEI